MPDNPETRQEMYLSAIAGLTGDVPEPITREEKYLQAILDAGGTGGGGGGGGTPGVTSWNGRRNAVYPRAGDYRATQINTDIPGKTVEDRLNDLEDGAVPDSALSTGSRKPVENRVIAQRFIDLEYKTIPPGGASGDFLTKKTGTDYDTEWASGENLMKKTDYDRNRNGKVDKAEASDALQGPTYKATLKNTRADTYVLTEEDKAKAGGVVPLDSNRKILPEFLPDSIMAGLTYGGIFNATTRVVRLTPAAKSILGVSADTMTLQNSSTVPEGYPANAELFYITTVAGTFAGIDYSEGDWLISLGTEWQHLQNGSKVSSVLGKTGAVDFDSDEVIEGITNLYMTALERAKLRDIEAEATKDEHVIQTAQVITSPDDPPELVLTNKDGTVTRFTGGGDAGDLSEYLKKTGNASLTTVEYTPVGTKQNFTGNERTDVLIGKIVGWLRLLEDVAFSGDYNDLYNVPTRLSEFTNDGNGNMAQPFITRTANNLVNYYPKDSLYTKEEIDDLLDAVSNFTFILADELPTTNINRKAIYYIPNAGGAGYDRYQRIGTSWAFLGSTDVDMSEYLKTDGNGSAVTVAFTAAAERVALATGDTLAVLMGKIDRYLRDLKLVAFTGSWQDLEDANELATQEDLEDYVPIQQAVTDAGKVLGIGDDGKVTPVDGGGDSVVKAGDGLRSIIGNDLAENKAFGAYSAAFGDGVASLNVNQFSVGRYNSSDPGLVFTVGNGTSGARSNAFAVDDPGNAYAKKEVFVGNNTDNIVEPSSGNSLTPKRYVDRTIEESIAQAGLLRSMVVAVVPTVEDADNNTLYLVPDPTAKGHYLQYKKVLKSTNPDVYEMANLGGTQLTMEGSQVTELPQPSAAFAGKVYQYVGNDSTYIKGAQYVCDVRPFYAWLRVGDSNNIYFTEHVPVINREYVYRGSHGVVGQICALTASGDASTFTDGLGNTYTRMTTEDLSNYYQWLPLLTKTSELTNDGHGTGQVGDFFMTQQEYDSQKSTKTSDLINDGNGTGNVRDAFVSKADLLNLIYPIGSIYMSMNATSPATLFGGTWSQIGDGYYLRASSSGAGNTLNAQLPNVTGSFRFSSGSQGHPEVSSPTGAFKTASNGNLTYPWPTDGTSGGPRTVNFSLKYFNDSLYVDNGTVQPKSLKVYMWRRIADAKPVTGITLSTTDLHVRVGSISRVKVTVNPADADNPAYTITSSDTSIAVPDGDYGVIRGKKVGTTTVRFTSVSKPTVYADCTVTVEPSDWSG